jgi:hypothetical protein
MDIAVIREKAFKREEQLVRRNYTSEQLGELKTQHSEKAMERSDLEDSLVEMSRPLKADIKELKAGERDLLTHIRNRYYDNREEVYLVPDYDNGTMEIYDAKGELVGSRPIHPSERQGNLLPTVAA